MSAIGANMVAIAQLTHTSMPPHRSTTRSAAAATAAGSDTSAAMANAAPPAFSTSSPALLSPGDSRARSATCQPRRANARAVARPTPAVAPVTTTVRRSLLDIGCGPVLLHHVSSAHQPRELKATAERHAVDDLAQ